MSGRGPGGWTICSTPVGRPTPSLHSAALAEALATRRQVSKLAAAHAGMSKFPEWSELIDWAREWWYNGGSDLDHGRFGDVRRFVDDVSARLLRHHDPGRDPAEPTL